MADRLKPCPFCGTTPEVLKAGKTWAVGCSPCSGRGTVEFEGHTKAEVIENWNSRTMPKPDKCAKCDDTDPECDFCLAACYKRVKPEGGE